jgi:ribosome biogenesis GTPase / thiamine phosphate phosphatase
VANFITGLKMRLRFRPLEIGRPIGNGRAVIHFLFSRRTSISRKAAGKPAKRQIVCANMDYVFVVTSMNHEFNVRRVERYLSIAWDSGAKPVALLTKADLCKDPAEFKAKAESAAQGAKVHVISAVTGSGMAAFSEYFKTGHCGVFLGSSGVGKSTIINALAGLNIQTVAAIRSVDDRGRHTTTSRQMFLLPSGGIVIDTPGMRELGLWDNQEGLSKTFADIETIALDCRYRNCDHRHEPGCAVLLAAQAGMLESDRIDSYHKLRSELEYFASKEDQTIHRKRKSFEKKACKAQKQIYKNKGW